MLFSLCQVLYLAVEMGRKNKRMGLACRVIVNRQLAHMRATDGVCLMEPRGGDGVFIPAPNMREKLRCQENEFEKRTKRERKENGGNGMKPRLFPRHHQHLVRQPGTEVIDD